MHEMIVARLMGLQTDGGRSESSSWLEWAICNLSRAAGYVGMIALLALVVYIL